MPDFAVIRNAIIAKLGADAALLTEATNGVYYKVAPDGLKRIVMVSQVEAEIVRSFQGRSFVEGVYAVEAQMMKGAGGNPSVAAGRIDDLLDPQPPAAPATLSAAGYTLMSIVLEQPIDEVERDEADLSIIWYRRGGNYRVVMST